MANLMQKFIALYILCGFVGFSTTDNTTAQTTALNDDNDATEPHCIRTKNFYYWKPYHGKIPEDAFKAAKNYDGSPSYIGTSYFSRGNVVFPTIIEPNKKAYIIIGKVKLIAPSAKILCSTNNTLFKWVPTDTIKIKSITGCQQIQGGENVNAIITIGRANNQGRTITGRVYDDTKLNGLYIHDSSLVELKIKEFEVLVYDCVNPWAEKITAS